MHNILFVIDLAFSLSTYLLVEIKCQLDATNEFFIADLIACSTCFGHHYAHHRELERIIQVVAAFRIWCLVFKLSIWCGAEGCVSGLRAASFVASSWHFISTYYRRCTVKTTSNLLIYLSDLQILCTLWEGSRSQKPATAKCRSFYLSEVFISDLLQYDPPNYSCVPQANWRL
jgi:hypothetical protein